MAGLPEIGDIIDDTYEIKKMIGKGGFGAVFLAKHIPMERDVALKMLLAHGPDPGEMIERFRREVMAIRILSHPNTVRIFDFRDSPEDLHLYYTMEYLKGVTLKGVLQKEGAQSPRRVRRILIQTLKSLAEAHAQGIIHRDLKPANIMIVDMHGEQDFVKVLDFGIAKILEHEEDEDNPLTSAGMLVGTLRYMAPEQIKGHQLGAYSDIYSLGLIANELLIGKNPYAGTSRWEIIQAQAGPEPVQFAPELLNSPLTPILRKALDKDPNARYMSAEQMLRDLNQLPEYNLSDMPLVLNAGHGTPQHSSLSHSSSSASRFPAKLTPPPGINTPNSEVSQSSQRIPVAQPVAAASASGAFNTAPTPTLAPPPSMPPTPALGGTSPAPMAPPDAIAADELIGDDTGPIRNVFDDSAPMMSAPSAFDADRSESVFEVDPVPLPQKSKVPKGLIAGGIAVLLLLGLGGALLVSSSSSDDTSSENTSPDESTASSNQTSEAPAIEETTPPPVEQKPREITLALSNDDTFKALVYKGEDEAPFATLPGTIELEDGQSLTLRIEADGYKPLEQVVNAETPDTLTLSLDKLPASSNADKQDAPPEDKTTRLDKPPANEKSSGWAEVDAPKKNPKKSPKKTPKKTPKKDKKVKPENLDIPTF